MARWLHNLLLLGYLTAGYNFCMPSFIRNLLSNTKGQALLQAMLGVVVVTGLGGFMLTQQQTQDKGRLTTAYKQQKNIFVREMTEGLANYSACIATFNQATTLANGQEFPKILSESGDAMYDMDSSLGTQQLKKLVLVNYSGGAGPRLSNAALRVSLSINDKATKGYGGPDASFDIPIMLFTQDDKVTFCMSDPTGALKVALLASCSDLNGNFNTATGTCEGLHGPDSWTLNQIKSFMCSSSSAPCVHPHRNKICAPPSGVNYNNWVMRGFDNSGTPLCVCIPEPCPDASKYCPNVSLGDNHCGVSCGMGTAYCPADCSPQPVNWGACSANLPSATSGQSHSLQDSVGPSIGTHEFVCVNGGWAPGASTCAVNCGQELNKQWTVGSTNCFGDLPTGTEGDPQSIPDDVGPATGIGNFICQNGSWTPQAGSTCASTPCPTADMEWGSDALNKCKAQIATGPEGTPRTANDSSLLNGTARGSADFTCVNAVWVPGASNCSITTCPAGTKTWSVGSESCEGSVAQSNPGDQPLAKDLSSSPTLGKGEATFKCEDNGTWSGPTSPSCSQSQCDAVASQTWGSSPTICQASLPDTASGGERDIIDNVDTTTGSARYRCNNGTWQLVSSLCEVSKCPAISGKSWNVAGESCLGDLPEGDLNQVANLSDSTTTGPSTAVGAASFTCVSGSWTENGGSTCAVAGCDAVNSKSWTVAGKNCTANLPARPMNALETISDVTGTDQGSASFRCVSGTWTEQSGSTCAPQGCGAQASVSWNGTDGSVCTGSLLARGHGVVESPQDTTTPTTGSAQFTCNNGTWEKTSESCTNAPTLACWKHATAGKQCETNGSCPTVGASASTNCRAADGSLEASQSVSCISVSSLTDPTCAVGVSGNYNCAAVAGKSWTVDGSTCSGNLSAAAHNAAPQTITYNASTFPQSNTKTGQASFQCQNGNWVEQPGSTCRLQCAIGHPGTFGGGPAGGICTTCRSGWEYLAVGETSQVGASFNSDDGGTTACHELGYEGPVNEIVHGCELQNGSPSVVIVSESCGGYSPPSPGTCMCEDYRCPLQNDAIADTPIPASSAAQCAAAEANSWCTGMPGFGSGYRFRNCQWISN